MASSTSAPVVAHTTVGVELTLHTSSPNRDQSTDKENHAPFIQNLADRIKERSRRAASTNQIAPVTTTIMQPQQLPSPSPQKSRPLKRPAGQATSKKPPRHQKVFEDEGAEDSEDTSTIAFPTAKKSRRRQKVVPDDGVEIREDTSAIASPTLTAKDLSPPKRPAVEEASKKPARRQRVSPDEDAEVRGDNSATLLPTPKVKDIRPLNDSAGNRDFAQQVIRGLNRKLKSLNPAAMCFGDRQNQRINYLLTTASPADDTEMLFLLGVEAAAKLQPGVFHTGPILTDGQQPMPLQTVHEFLDEYYDDNTQVWIQDPSVTYASGDLSVREVPIGKVKNRLFEGKKSKRKSRPWNCLELATHVEDGLRPTFLAGEDTRLLTKLKLEQAPENAGRRSYPQGYKEVEKWALLAEAGALTEPHQDSHGYSTYITANHGRIGFGWLSYPTAEDREQWTEDPESIPGDRYRYVVLQPGQTVYFPAGTVHFVFRLPSEGHTLAFGGHVLRCSNIVHWARTLLEEQSNPQITNEDLTSSAPGYLNRVEKFVLQAQKNGSLEKWGGAEEVEAFLRLKEEFVAT
ncbi:hypothetical protein Q7P35_007936 [Cladosporium inversicolor]